MKYFQEFIKRLRDQRKETNLPIMSQITNLNTRQSDLKKHLFTQHQQYTTFSAIKHFSEYTNINLRKLIQFVTLYCVKIPK